MDDVLLDEVQTGLIPMDNGTTAKIRITSWSRHTNGARHLWLEAWVPYPDDSGHEYLTAGARPGDRA